MSDSYLPRRDFLAASGAALATSPFVAGGALADAERKKERPKVAAIFTAFAHRTHAHVILENFLEPYLFNGKMTKPGVDVVSFYADQFPEEDMARSVAKDYGIPIFPTFAGALTLGKKDLAVDAILLIGEHGDYPTNEHGVRMYPRKRLFDQCAKVIEAAGRGVPLFCDKHLSYRWDWAREMYETARRLNVPLMAGSSVPLAQRRPPLEIKGNQKIEQAVSIHGGPFEIYDFHGLEVLQTMVEARDGGESGVESVQLLQGDALWDAAERGQWDPLLAEAALATELGKDQLPLRELVESPALNQQTPYGVLVKYIDGLTGVSLRLGKRANRFLYAHRRAGGAVEATWFYGGPWNNRNLFKALSHAIQSHFREQRSPYPVERTLLTTGLTAAMVDSRAAEGKTIATPHLKIAYKAADWSSFRERGESWKILSDDVPEPRGITRGGHRAG